MVILNTFTASEGSHFRSRVSKWLFQVCAMGALAAFSVTAFAQSSEQEQDLQKEMAEAQAQLDDAARRVAELSRQMSGGEVARVFKRMSVGQRKAMLGVRIDDARDGQGVRVLSVTPDGPAEEAGVESGDVLRSINGVSLTDMSSSEAIEALLKTLKTLDPQDVASLVLSRDGRRVEIDVTTESVSDSMPRFGEFRDGSGKLRGLGKMLEDLAVEIPEVHADITIDGDFSSFDFDASQFEDLKQLPARLEEVMGKLSSSGPIIAMLGGSGGLSHQFRFAPVTPGLGDYFGVKRGVLVTAVPEDDTLGLQEGDVLLAINSKPVDSKHDVHAVFAGAEEGDTLSIEVVRQRESLTVDVVAPKAGWGKHWSCRYEGGEDGDDKRFERCESKDGSAFSFRFSDDDE